MSERQKQADFLKNLLACDSRPQHQLLQERINAAERDQKCLRSAFRLVVVINMVALSVLAYLTVLQVPESLAQWGDLLLRFSQALALGSAMCLGVFIGLRLWQGGAIHRLHEEARRLLTAEMRDRSRPVATASTVTVQQGDTEVYQIQAPDTAPETRVLKAS